VWFAKIDPIGYEVARYAQTSELESALKNLNDKFRVSPVAKSEVEEPAYDDDV
jgi:hypothetical protein